MPFRIGDSVYVNAAAGAIYAGSSQVVRGVVGELPVGLPKEHKPVKETINETINETMAVSAGGATQP